MICDSGLRKRRGIQGEGVLVFLMFMISLNFKLFVI